MRQSPGCYTAPLAIALALSGSSDALAQAASMRLEATVVDASTGEALPTVVVRNPVRGTGTATDESGAFALPANLPGDTLVLSAPGYYTEHVPVLEEPASFIGLTPYDSEFGDIVVLTDGNTDGYLFDLVHQVRRKRGTDTREAKTYAFVEGTVDGDVAELAEGYYNGTYAGGAAVDLRHKKSRLGVQVVGDHLVTATPAAQQIWSYDVFRSDPNFPDSPLSLPRAKVQKAFALELVDRYREDGADVFVIDFTPLTDATALFAGRVWIDREGGRLLRVTLTANGATQHPFTYRKDAAKWVDLRLDKSFATRDGDLVPATTRADCRATYATPDGDEYVTELEAVSVAYDFDTKFDLPSLPPAEGERLDYRNASPAPYDSAFWAQDHEFRLHDRASDINTFVQRGRLHPSRVVEFLPPGVTLEGAFATPYLLWDTARIEFRSGLAEDIQDLREVSRTTGEWFTSGADLYLDVTELPSGELTYQTAAAIDPLAASFPFQVDAGAQAFLNMQFDLLEVQRRWLEEELAEQPSLTRDIIETLYVKHRRAYETRRDLLAQESKHGRKIDELEMWSAHIYEQLGVDNFRRYRLGRR